MTQFSLKSLFGRTPIHDTHHVAAKIAAMEKSLATIEFSAEGKILTANETFLSMMGYRLSEIIGRHHSLFVNETTRASPAYHEFWTRLQAGQYQTGEFARIDKNGRKIWIQASYSPVLDRSGRTLKVVKYAIDITAQKRQSLDYAGQVLAINKAQAVIEFDLDGSILSANENFLHAVGYGIDDIRGKHHSMFVEPAERDSPAYKAFWYKLKNGEYQKAEYRRIGNHGKEIWIQASYNPIFDDTGKPFKIVKLATDITQSKITASDMAGQLAAINKSQAVIEFNLDGTIIDANANFLGVLGYRADEVRGRHHSIFVPPADRNTAAYRAFWGGLAKGEFQSGEFKRVGKQGNFVYIQATYNPILDLNGRPYKVVKFASDVTAQAVARQKSDRVRHQLETVAAGAEELNVSVSEISSNMVKVKDTADGAVVRVAQADSTTQKLGEVAESMGGIVTLIQTITDQVNLLALNATIEAARAGEAGRGFAVVAQEVKNLANQAKAATEQITSEINGVRSVSKDVAEALRGINQAINAVQEYVASTGAAIEQQSAVARDMSSQMQFAAAEAAQLGS